MTVTSRWPKSRPMAESIMFSVATFLALAVALLSSPVAAYDYHRHLEANDTIINCRTPPPTEDEVLEAIRVDAKYRGDSQPTADDTKLNLWGRIAGFFFPSNNRRLEESDSPTPFSVVVPVYYFIVDVQSGGTNPTIAEVHQQHAILNNRFSGTGFQFSAESIITSVPKFSWYKATQGSADEANMKSTLRQQVPGAGKGTLLVYLTSPGDNCFGWTTYPSQYAGNPTNDGIVLKDTTLPGGTVQQNYDSGHQLVHQVGHWLGLFHTFEFGCDNNYGDLVADTETMTSSSPVDCPSPKPDTCSGGELDPIENFMTFSYDSCLTTFTTGQAARMQAQWNEYRA